MDFTAVLLFRLHCMAWVEWTALANGFVKDILAARTKIVIREEV